MAILEGLNTSQQPEDIQAYSQALAVYLKTLISGEDTENNRLMTYELWDYSDDNVSADGALKEAPGVLGVAQVITADSGITLTFYDSADDSGTVLGSILCTTAGTQIKFGRPFATALYAKFSGATTAVVAVGIL